MPSLLITYRCTFATYKYEYVPRCNSLVLMWLMGHNWLLLEVRIRMNEYLVFACFHPYLISCKKNLMLAYHTFISGKK